MKKGIRGKRAKFTRGDWGVGRGSEIRRQKRNVGEDLCAFQALGSGGCDSP